MEKEELDMTLCVFDPKDPGPYEQYILPYINAQMQQDPESFAALGAVWKSFAVGAAVITEDPESPGAAAVASLFVDPQVRGRGVGTALLAACAEAAAAAGAETLTISYTLGGEELEAMDRAVRAMGGEPAFRIPVYTMDSTDYHDSRLVGRAFRPDYTMPENVVRFTDLKPEQIEALLADQDVPWYSPGTQPELSLAFLQNGHIAGFWLGCKSAPGNYTVMGVWRSPDAPFNIFNTLLAAHVNLCYTHCGGEFLYHCSATIEIVYKLIQTYTEGKCRRLEQHHAVLTLNSDKDIAAGV